MGTLGNSPIKIYSSKKILDYIIDVWQSPTQQTNEWSKLTIEPLENGEICSKLTIKTTERFH